MKQMDRLFDLNDVLIMPETLSDINSRMDVCISHNGMHLPIITAPMDSVCDLENYKAFTLQGLNVCLPRGLDNGGFYEKGNGSLIFHSFSLDEFEESFLKRQKPDVEYVCIDMANGHMKRLYSAVKDAQHKYQQSLKIIVGNIANPLTFDAYAKLGIWGVRCSIGTGGMCTTTVNTAIGYPMGSLIHDCDKMKKKYGYKTHIIADGGMKSHSDIIKALALGANYVMVGSLFAYTYESCAKPYAKLMGRHIELNGYWYGFFRKHGMDVYKRNRGMSTREVQMEWGKGALRASEGIVSYGKVHGSLEAWVDGFSNYLRSAMSYTNASRLSEFIGDTQFNLISENAYRRFDK